MCFDDYICFGVFYSTSGATGIQLHAAYCTFMYRTFAWKTNKRVLPDIVFICVLADWDRGAFSFVFQPGLLYFFVIMKRMLVLWLLSCNVKDNETLQNVIIIGSTHFCRIGVSKGCIYSFHTDQWITFISFLLTQETVDTCGPSRSFRFSVCYSTLGTADPRCGLWHLLLLSLRGREAWVEPV